jgi:hypothetical protein
MSEGAAINFGIDRRPGGCYREAPVSGDLTQCVIVSASGCFNGLGVERCTIYCHECISAIDCRP